MNILEQSVWDRLAQTRKPVLLYGMGDGADKILHVLRKKNIPVAGVFANDAFVRGQHFHGFPVRTLAQSEALFPDFVALLCFASARPEVMAQIEYVASRHELYAPDVPVVGEGVFTAETLREHADAAATVHSLLADGQSRRVFQHVLAYKISGKLDYLRACETPKDEAYAALLRPTPNERYVDAGAYNGDTIRELLAHTGTLQSLLALEPDKRNFQKLCAFVETLTLANAACHNVAAWDKPATLPFAHTSGRQATLFGTSRQSVQADSLDRLLGGEPATLIKYDVEGAEAQAILGSARTIRACKPRLIVSAYHRNEDLFTLPLLLHRLRPDYRFYLRHHPYFPAWDTNLYCV